MDAMEVETARPRGRIKGWFKSSMAPSNRIFALDFLRGYFMIAILLDHLYFFPSGLDIFTGRGELYASCAEGFFFISGLVLGVVRGRKLIDRPFKEVASKLLRRAVKLYITSIILVALFTVIGWCFNGWSGLKDGILPITHNIFDTVWQIISLQYVYGWADYLRLYAIFMLVSPLAMWLLRRGKWKILLGASLGLWLLVPGVVWMWTKVSNWYWWTLLAWQALFFGAMIIGFYFDNIRRWFYAHRKKFKTIVKRIVVILAIATFAANSLLLMIGPFGWFGDGNLHNILTAFQDNFRLRFFHKEFLPPARMALFLLWFTAGFFVVNKFRKWLAAKLGWLIMAFGQNSLYSYIVSAIVLFFAHLFLSEGAIWWNLLISLLCIAIVWVCIKSKFLMKIIPR
jgi:hypothetical protein